MSGELKKILIISAGFLCFFFLLMFSNNFPTIFNDLQIEIFFGTILSMLLVVVVLKVVKWS